MSTETKERTGQSQANKIPASIVWFEVPADDLGRAREFYSALFGWKIERFPDMPDYWHIDTGGADASPDGGLMTRKHPEHRGITNYVMVESVDESAARAQKLGGTICVPRTAVPQMGYFAICQDTEGNTFALWERNERAE